MGMQQRNVIEAYATLALLERKNSPMYAGQIREYLGKHIRESRLPGPENLAQILRHTHHFQSKKSDGDTHTKYSLSNDAADILSPHVSELSELSDYPGKLYERIIYYTQENEKKSPKSP